ncbi:hypothetical protein [Streptomyces sp. NPDC047000]|uniref:hypothetical protein n=1 Tax=Streptomyces sp. NPDC047000 TaxID=3155474 RepID=UPI0033E8092A
MNRAQREARVRQLMEGSVSRVPPDLYAQAVRRGTRLLRRRTAGRRLLWLLLFAAAVAFTGWAVVVHPWAEPPSPTAPPLTGW